MRVSTLLAALAAAIPAAASALSISEGTFGDFGDSFATRSVLPAQTDEISGQAHLIFYGPFDIDSDPDFVAFTDLEPGQAFSVSALFANSGLGGSVQFLDSTGTAIAPSASLPSDIYLPTVIATGVIPASGEIVLRILSNDFGLYYELALDAPRVVVPEPGTALLLGSGLALLARWNTRRS